MQTFMGTNVRVGTGNVIFNDLAEIISSDDLSIIVLPNVISSPFDFESKPKLYLKPEHPPP